MGWVARFGFLWDSAQLGMNGERILHSLDGEWRLFLDPDDVGKVEGWFDGKGLPKAIPVNVPSVWDRWVPDYVGVAWYLRQFELGEEWVEAGGPKDRLVSLEFEPAPDHAEVWINGIRLGEHEGGDRPFALDATDAAKEGRNHIAVRLVNPRGAEGFGDVRPGEFPAAKPDAARSFAGLWGSVSLVGKSHVHITDLFILPDLRRKRITVEVSTSEPGQVRLQIEGASPGTEGAASETVGEAGTLLLEFPDFEAWSPRAPVLYTLRCELLQGETCVDAVAVRFGMREFTVKENRFYLNNRPIFLRGVRHQPGYPLSLAAPESAELARKELELAKEAGFNFIRVHLRTAPRILLDVADEIGLLVCEEPAIAGIEESERFEERCEREVRELILRDRNHPSVVMWSTPDGSGAGGRPDLERRNALCALARGLDPTRLILDGLGATNLSREPARYMRPYHDELESYDDLHVYRRAPVSRASELYFGNSGEPESLVLLSDFGFGGLEDLADVLAQYDLGQDSPKDAEALKKVLETGRLGFEARELDRVFSDFSGLAAAACLLQCDAARLQTDAIRANTKIAGYCYTQLCDGGPDFSAGILDRWRRPKAVFQTFKEVQSDLRPIIHVAQTNLAPRQELPVTVTLVNEARLEDRADLSLQVIGPTNQVLWKKKRNIKIPRHGKELWSGTISASGSAGTHKFAVHLMQGMKRIAENVVEFHVYEPAEACDIDFHILDPNDQWTAPCRALAKPANINAPIHVVPPLAGTIRAYPDNALAQILGQAKEGAVALFFGPPDDWNDLAGLIDPAIRATSRDAVGHTLGVFHYNKLHPVFDGLPAGGLMGQPYRNTIAAKTFVETGEEDICGTFDAAACTAGRAWTDAWGSDILVRRYGSGRIVFTHLRVLENLGKDPVADHLFVNMLKHFSRRSVPSGGTLPIHQQSVEWLRKERTGSVRHWKVLGMFPNWGGQGHDTEYPPEKDVDFEATYPGWYDAIAWKDWHSVAGNGHVVDLQEAFTPDYQHYPCFDRGVGYAYAEFATDRRGEVTVNVGIQDAMKVWLNGTLIFETADHLPAAAFETRDIDAYVRQGRNTLLVKVTKIPGPFRFSIDSISSGEPLGLRWWK